MKKLNCLLLTAVAIFSSCEQQAPIPEEDMTSIMYDMFLIDNCVDNSPELMAQSDSVYVYSAIFEKYGYTNEDMKEAIKYYISDIEVYGDIIQEVRSRLSAREMELEEADRIEMERLLELDSLAQLDTLARRDSLARKDSLAVRDSLALKDSISVSSDSAVLKLDSARTPKARAMKFKERDDKLDKKTSAPSRRNKPAKEDIKKLEDKFK